MRGKPFHTASFTVERIVHPFAERFGAIERKQVGGTGNDLQLLGHYLSDINTVRIQYRLNNVPLLVNLFVRFRNKIRFFRETAARPRFFLLYNQLPRQL